MVRPAWQVAKGIRLDADELLALREALPGSGKAEAARRSGAIPSRQQGSGMDLREIRAYVPGDDPRRLDPAATARTGRPHVRALNEDRDDVTLLIADFRPAMLWGTADAMRSVRAAQHLALMGWQAVQRRGTVGLVIAEASGARSVAAAAGDAQMATLCRMLAHRHAEALAAGQAVASLAEALALPHRLAPPGARVTLATLPGGWAGAEDQLARLARGRRLDVALILDPVEVAPPAFALPVEHGGLQRLARLRGARLSDHTDRLRELGAAGRGITS
ncbi:Protein of unknown function DUF58 [Paracoccus tibetensis]|uniref:DUF58 domain-containing protein n=1 Tax=Paracoccus tibetensis TaxID=336292 RepID=A0A1G5K4Z8_9RHOB|nr:Protein of unknown function DUF58 [Paracoccus tibetensis]